MGPEQFKLWVSDITLFDTFDIDPQTIIFGPWNINTPDIIQINHMISLLRDTSMLGDKIDMVQYH